MLTRAGVCQVVASELIVAKKEGYCVWGDFSRREFDSRFDKSFNALNRAFSISTVPL